MTAAVMLLVAGCASGSGSAALAPSSGDIAALAGAWRGYFRQVAAGDTGFVNGDIELRVEPDGRYTGTWTTRQVAGSTRAGSTPISGTVRLSGSQVIFHDWRDLILQRRGDGLHGLTIDPGTGRTLSVYLERVP